VIADAVLVAVAFLLGSLPMGVIVAKLFYGTDIRAAGSGNIGAANALRTLGRGAGAVVLVLDALKGFLPAVGAQYVGGPTPALLAGFAAVAGHCCSPWLGFRGGKGVATALGALFGIAWQAALIFAAIWILAVGVTGYASVGSLLACLASIAALGFFLDWRAALYGACVAAVVVWRHRDNIRRLRAGCENRLIGPGRSASNPGGLP
jgi:glycerol-3-phosphate acyltransferase PlsY